MSGRSAQWIWAIMLITSLTSTAVLSQNLDDCLQTLNAGIGLSTMCSENSNVQRQLEGFSLVSFTCESDGGGEIVIDQWDMYPSNGSGIRTDIADGNSVKYTTSTDRLEIKNLVPEDEGAYICSLSVNGGTSMRVLGGCLVIYAKVEFVTDEPQTNIVVKRGESIIFDTALVNRSGGSCSLSQSIGVLQLQKDGIHSVNCHDFPNCSCEDGFMYSAYGNITKLNATDDDAGTYRLGVSVGVFTGSNDVLTNVLQRTFNVMITDDPTTSVAESMSTPAPTSTSPTATPPGTPEGAGREDDQNPVAIVVPIIIVMVMILMVVAIVIVILYILRKRTSVPYILRKKTSKKKPEPFYDHVSNVRTSNGSGQVNIVDDYGYHAPISCVEDNRHSAHLDDVYLQDRPTDQEGQV